MKLQSAITHYVTFKRALGERCKTSETMLKAFNRAMGIDVELTTIEADSVAAFLSGSGSATRYWHDKYWRLHSFYRYAISRGFVKSSPLPAIVPKLPERFVPFIYSQAELRRLLDATAIYVGKQALLEATRCEPFSSCSMARACASVKLWRLSWRMLIFQTPS